MSSEHDPDSVLEQAWAQSSGPGQWPLPKNLHRPLHVFQTWLRQLLWELSSLAAQVQLLHQQAVQTPLFADNLLQHVARLLLAENMPQGNACSVLFT